MSYIDRIDSIVDSLDLGDSKFALQINESYIRVKDKEWNPKFEGESFYESLLTYAVKRKFNRTDKKYEIDKERTYGTMRHTILDNLRVIFAQCSPAKEASRTKVYRSFFAIVRENNSKIDFMSSLFDIAEYFSNITQENAISSSINDVHRKNIYQLLCLMEKNYAKR